MKRIMKRLIDGQWEDTIETDYGVGAPCITHTISGKIIYETSAQKTERLVTEVRDLYCEVFYGILNVEQVCFNLSVIGFDERKLKQEKDRLLISFEQRYENVDTSIDTISDNILKLFGGKTDV